MDAAFSNSRNNCRNLISLDEWLSLASTGKQFDHSSTERLRMAPLWGHPCESVPRPQLVFCWLRSDNDCLQALSWPDVLTFLKGVKFAGPVANRMITVLLMFYQNHQQWSWPVLATLFQPGMHHLRRKIRSLARAVDEIDSNLPSALAEALHLVAPHIHNSDRSISSRVLNATFNIVRRECRLFASSPPYVVQDQYEIPIDDDSYTQVDESDTVLFMDNVLKRMVLCGSVSLAGCDVFRETLFHGQSLTAYAQLNGLSCETARKRRQRVIKEVRNTRSIKKLAGLLEKHVP